MTKYFGGNTLAAFKRTSPACTEVTTAGRFDSNYTDRAISIPELEYIETPAFSAAGFLSMRFDYYGPGVLTTSTIAILQNGANNGYRLRHNSGATSNLVLNTEYWNGSAWTIIGSTYVAASAVLRTLTWNVTLNNTVELLVNGTIVSSATGISGGATALTLARIFAPSGGAAFCSQVMLADYDLRDAHLIRAALSGNSATNTGQASGGYLDVGEQGINDATAIRIAAASNKAGQTLAGITVPSGYQIGAMVLSARGRVSGGDGKLGVRSGGTNYSSAGLGFVAGYEPRQSIVENDPATAARFTQAGFNSAEPYQEAA